MPVSPLFRRNAPSGRPSASAQICAITVFDPWPISTAPWCSTTVPSGAMPTLIVDGLGSEVLPQPYQQDATPTPRRTRSFCRLNASPRRPARAANAAPARRGKRRCRRRTSSFWPVTVSAAVAQRVLLAERQPVHAELAGQFVVERLLHDRRLRHAEAAERAGDRPVGVDRPAGGAVVRRQIGTGRMHRHAVGHRRAPARIGAGVEIAGEDHAGHAALGIGADRRLHRCRVTLGGRHHRFRTRVG